jgi:hypothetical protein
MIDYRKEENKFLCEIKNHINNAMPYLKRYTNVKLSTHEEDTKYSFDMKYNSNFTISVRIRKNKFKRHNDLTIRSKNNGSKTEIHKIMEGKGQVYFYAYMDLKEESLEKVVICSVDAIRYLYNKKIHTQEKSNRDGTSLIGFKFNYIKMHDPSFYKWPQT